MFCFKCGKQIADDMKFCPYCGVETINSSNSRKTNISGNTNTPVTPGNTNYPGNANYPGNSGNPGNANYLGNPGNPGNANYPGNPGGSPQPAAPEGKSSYTASKVLGIIGLVLGILSPLVGFILGGIGIGLTSKGRKAHDQEAINVGGLNIFAIGVSIISLLFQVLCC